MMTISYQTFQDVKISFFEKLLNSQNAANLYTVTHVSVKLNFKSNRIIKYVKALLPQALAGDLDEMRLILTPDGIRDILTITGISKRIYTSLSGCHYLKNYDSYRIIINY